MLLQVLMMQYNNPFKYGVVVTGDDFINRKEEITVLTENLLAGQHMILYSSRKLGKTSLMKQVTTLLPNHVLPIYIDIFGITSKKTLAKKIVNDLTTTVYPTPTTLKNELQKLLSRVTVKIILVQDTIEVELQTGEYIRDEELEEIFDLPEQLAKQKGKRLVVMFDEFQNITEIGPEQIEKLMRSKFQHHKNVSYLFAGSKTTLMKTLFNDQNHAFYWFGKEMKLNTIPKPEFAPFIHTKFIQTGKTINAQAIDYLLNFTNGHPYFTQKLCQQIWYDTLDAADEETVIQAIQKIIRAEGDFYEQTWNALTKMQKRLLVGLSADPDANKYAQRFIQKYDLQSAAHVKRAYEALENKRIIEERKISDIFFSEWVKTLTT